MSSHFTASGFIHALASRTHGPRPTIVETSWSGGEWTAVIAGSPGGDMEHRSTFSIRLAHLELTRLNEYEYQVWGYPMSNVRIEGEESFPVLMQFLGQKILLLHAAKQPPHAKPDVDGFAPVHRFEFEKGLELPDSLDPFTFLPYVIGAEHWTMKWHQASFPFPHDSECPSLQILSIRDGYVHGQVIRGMFSDGKKMCTQYHIPFVHPLLINRVIYAGDKSMQRIDLYGMTGIANCSLHLMTLIRPGQSRFSLDHPEIMQRLLTSP